MKPLARAQLRAALAFRRPDDHKGVFGHVLIVGGSRGMAGAVILAARAALRSGAGLVTAAVPAAIQSTVAAAVPEALTLGLPDNGAGTLRPGAAAALRAAHREKGYTVLALGPGLSRHGDAAAFAPRLLEALPLPAVVDADALNALAALGPRAARLLRRRTAPTVYTPHPAEMGRCLRLSTREVQRRRAECAARLAREWSGIALLKGHRTLVSDGRRTVENRTGGPGLAKGGSGDVLTGLIAGLWAQRLASGRGKGEPAFASAALGAWLLGKAGELAERSLTGRAMTASDVIGRLPGAFSSL